MDTFDLSTTLAMAEQNAKAKKLAKETTARMKKEALRLTVEFAEKLFRPFDGKKVIGFYGSPARLECHPANYHPPMKENLGSCAAPCIALFAIQADGRYQKWEASINHIAHTDSLRVFAASIAYFQSITSSSSRIKPDAPLVEIGTQIVDLASKFAEVIGGILVLEEPSENGV